MPKYEKVKYFITLEDITYRQYDQNHIVYNFVLPLDKRLEQFVDVMERYFPHHTFAPDELEHIASFKTTQPDELIQCIQEYIYGHELQHTD